MQFLSKKNTGNFYCAFCFFRLYFFFSPFAPGGYGLGSHAIGLGKVIGPNLISSWALGFFLYLLKILFSSLLAYKIELLWTKKEIELFICFLNFHFNINFDYWNFWLKLNNLRISYFNFDFSKFAINKKAYDFLKF